MLSSHRRRPLAVIWVLVLPYATLSSSSTAQETHSACVWRADTSSCAWNLLAPLGSLASSELSPGALNEATRSLIRAALLLEGCDARGVAGGRSTCEATADGACTWRSFGRSDAASPIWPLLSQLLRSTSTTATSSSDERCVPASLETVIQPYLDMTAPEACYDIADVPTCFAAAPRCFYEDHDSHGHCMPDWQFVRKSWSWPAPLAAAAEQVSFLCNPESYWLDSHESRPARLSEAACRATATAVATATTPAGRFSLNPTQWARMLAAASSAGIINVTDVFLITPPVAAPFPPPAPPAAPPRSNPAAGAVVPQPPPLPLPVPAVSSCPPPPVCPVCALAAAPSSGSADSGGQQNPQVVDSGLPRNGSEAPSATVTLVAPTCQLLLSSSQCAPTLMGLAAAVLAAVSPPQSSTPPGTAQPPSQQQSPAVSLAAARAMHGSLSAPGRTLLLAASEALTCASGASSTSVSAAATATDSCSDSALTASPVAQEALVAMFAPACAALGERACTSRPGCVLQAHGDHFDCVRSASYAADYLLLPPPATAGASAAAATQTAVAGNSSGAAALAAAVQSIARQCRASLPTCGQQQLLNATLTPQSLGVFTAVATGRLPGVTAGAGEGTSSPAAAPQPRSSVPGGLSADEGHSDDHDHDHEEDGHHEEEEEDMQLVKSLRIAGVFVVLAAGILGCCLPWTLMGWLQLRPLLLASVRAVSAGCILSLALVHVSMHAVSEMEGLVGGDGGGHDGHDHRRRHLRSRSLLASQLLVEFEDYGGGGHEEHEGGGGGRHHHPFPIGMCVVVFGFLLMAMLENVAHAIAERHFAKVAKASAPLALASSAAVVTVAATSAASGKYAGANAATCTSGTSAGTAAVGAFDVRLQVLTPPHPHHTDEDSGSLKCCNEDNTPAATTTTASPTSGAVAATPTVRQARSVTTAFMFELGCMAHSVIIGLALGTSTTVADCRALLVALSLHQFFEGFCLAAVLLGVGVRHWRMAVMVLSYAIMCPLGIAVGIAIVDTYDAESVTSRAVTGTINGVSGGLLLYLAAGMVISDFGPHSTCGASGAGSGTSGGEGCLVGRPWAAWERAVLFALLFASTAAFSVLALWA